MSFKTIASGTAAILAVIGAPFMAVALTPPVATRAEFEALQPGMTEPACAEAIGAPGEEADVEGGQGKLKRTVVWMNADGSTLTAVFEDGSLVSKSAERLK